MSLANDLERGASRAPGKVGLIVGERSWTYSQFNDAANHVAHGLAQAGISHGDRVALQLANSAELVISYYGCFKLGAIAVPINNRFAPSELEYTFGHAECRAAISQGNLYASVAALRHKLPHLKNVYLIDHHADSPDGTSPYSDLLALEPSDPAPSTIRHGDVAAILYTSGTTSRPKGVTHTHASLLATASLHTQCVGMDENDVVCVIPPMCHILGFATQMLTAVHVGGTMVVATKPEAGVILETIKRHGATRIAALPTLLMSMNGYPGKEAFRMPQMRTVCAGGDAVPVPIQEQFQKAFGPVVQEGCGMTEVIPFTLNVPGARKPGSIGRACPGMEIRLVDEADRDVPVGTVGEILVRSEAGMIGYWREPEITAATITNGYIRTGDLARLDEDGFYWFSGRKKEIIIRGGSNISPLEVEEALYQHPAVKEVGVVGAPSHEWGEIVWAFVALNSGASATEEVLKEFMRPLIAAYKIPAKIEFLDELPKGSTGKVHRRSLKARAAETSTPR